MRGPILVCAPGGIGAAVLLLCNRALLGALYVTTDQSGAQVGCDYQNTLHWTYHVTTPVADIRGARFVMKDGPKTTGPLTFTIVKGTYQDYLDGDAPLISLTLTNTEFDTIHGGNSQSFAPVLMLAADTDPATPLPLPITLLANVTYTGVLSSSAASNRSSEYFIKGGKLSFVDETGTPSGPPIIETESPIPEPLAITAGGVAGMMLLRRRGQRRTAASILNRRRRRAVALEPQIVRVPLDPLSPECLVFR